MDPENLRTCCLDLTPAKAQISSIDKSDLDALLSAAQARLELLWPHGKDIEYGYVQGANGGTLVQQEKVDATVASWTVFANVKFIKVANDAAAVAPLRIAFDPSKGNWSFVGTDMLRIPSPHATMNLGHITDKTDTLPAEKAAILHQFGHALGFLHEYPAYLHLDPEVTKELYNSVLGWDADEVKAQVLDVYEHGDITNYRAFDISSLMSYPLRSEQNTKHKTVEYNQALGSQDKAWLVINYPLAEVDKKEPTWTLSHALDVMAVPPAKRDQWLALSPKDVRARFGMWLAPQVFKQAAPPVQPVGESSEWLQRTCADLLEPKNKQAITGHLGFRAVMTKKSLLWDNHSSLTYSYLGGTPIQQGKVDETIGEWCLYANITFTKVDEEGQIRISFDPTLGSWSYVGKQCRNIDSDKATMNLGWISKGKGIEKDEKGTILHEFGHALGLLHEHQSPARGGALTLDTEAVYDFYTRTQNWSRDLVKEQIIDVYSQKDISNYSKFDSQSIMMYFMPAKLNKQRREVPPNHALSDTDKAYMVVHYPRDQPAPEAPKWTLSYALGILNVDEKEKDDILSSVGDADMVREQFANWNAQRKSSAKDKPYRSVVVRPDNRDWCASARITPPDAASDDHIALYAATILSKSLWLPGDTVKYWYQQPLYRTPISDGVVEPRARRVELLESVFKEYEAVANVKFLQVTSEKESDVRIWFNEGDVHERSWSRIGKDCQDTSRQNDPSKWGGDERTTLYLNLPKDQLHDRLKPKVDPALLRLCRHQVAHVLGLTHEHLGKKAEEAEDVGSIMLYPSPKPEAVGDRGTSGPDILDAKEIELMEKNVDLSDSDKALLQALYPTSRGRFGVALGTLKLQQQKLVDVYASLTPKTSDQPSGYPLAIAKLRTMVAAALHESAGSPRPQYGITGPSFDLQSETATREPTKGSFVTVIFKELEKLFAPAGGQIFTLQFPGRFLQMTEYAWDTKTAGIYGQFVKPLPANESEFRLTDQLYDVANIVSGPNGVSLSQVYEQTLNNLIPSYRANHLLDHQQLMREWLLKDQTVTPWIQTLMNSQQAAHSAPAVRSSSSSGQTPAFAVHNKLAKGSKTVSRMELSNALMQDYLDAKNIWETERDDMFAKTLKLKAGSEESEAALNELSRRLAHTTAARQSQLAAKYSDAVVRGYAHNVREYVGYLDVKSPAESLQDAKDALRESSMSSFDGSLRVYPVQMTPIDWFEGLSTSFTMEDLTSDPVLIEQQIEAKARQLDTLNTQLTILRSGGKGKIEELREKADRAQAGLTEAHSSLSTSYTHQVLSMAKTCFDKVGQLDVAQLATVGKNLNLKTSVVEQLEKDLGVVAQRQTTLTSASRAYNDAVAVLRLAEATDTHQQQEQIKMRIESVTREVNELTTRFTSLNRTGQRPAAAKGELKALKDVDLFPATNESSGGSRWQQLQLHHIVESDYSKQITETTVKTSGFSCNLWWGSFSTNTPTTSDGGTSSTVSNSKNEVEVGLRATLVTVDRSGWFRPQFFKQSSAYYHVDSRITWSKWPQGVRDMADLKEKGEQTFATLNKGLLPAFPVSYIICKDITIKIKNSQSSDTTSTGTLKKDSGVSGGVLCFSFSKSTSTTQTENSHSFQACSDGCVIRIPGPQVLGYIMQILESDETTDMPDKIPPGFFVPKDKSETSGKAEPMRDIKKPVLNQTLVEQIQNMLKEAHVPQDTLASVQEAVQKELSQFQGKEEDA